MVSNLKILQCKLWLGQENPVSRTHTQTPNSHCGDKVELTASGLNKKIHLETLITRNLPIPYFD